jgi:benzylsuccinate CoA-transferase BbsF subunit
MEAHMVETKLPLAGIKVVDFTQAIAGPIVTRMLGDFGATVVKVESHLRLDLTRTSSPWFKGQPAVDGSGYYSSFNSSKHSITLNLKNPGGKEIALKLVAWADIVTDNFAPGAMQRLGLDYDSLRRMKPDIICWSNSQMGQTGPMSGYRGFGAQSTALAGMFHISGWPDRMPAPPYGAYTDLITPYFAVATILAALDHRRKTGKGLYLDQSQYESGIQFLLPTVMDYRVNGNVLNRSGNRLAYAAPHGVFRCKGEDRWVAIAVFSDEEWRGFCDAIGSPDWANDERFASLRARKENEDELEDLVEQRTVGHESQEIEQLMQAAGVCASAVQSAREVFEDAQLKHREHLQYLEHAFMGRHAYDAQPVRLSRTPGALRPAPCLGQHNSYVLEELLGLTEDEVDDVVKTGAVTTAADLKEFGSLF